jgi:lysophospholipase
MECSIPLLMVLAGDDQLVRRDLSEHFFEKVKCSDKIKIAYPQFYHEIFNEVGKEQVWNDVAQRDNIR